MILVYVCMYKMNLYTCELLFEFMYGCKYACMYEHKLMHLWLVYMYVCVYVCMYVCTELSYLSNIAQELLTPMRSYELMQNMIDEDLSLLWRSGTYRYTNTFILKTYIHTYIHTYIQVPTVGQKR